MIWLILGVVFVLAQLFAWAMCRAAGEADREMEERGWDDAP